jgi:hypothetical protein
MALPLTRHASRWLCHNPTYHHHNHNHLHVVMPARCLALAMCLSGAHYDSVYNKDGVGPHQRLATLLM